MAARRSARTVALAAVTLLAASIASGCSRPRPTSPDSGTYPVTRFGAACDAENDDTAAIQMALDAADAAGGGVVDLPNGACFVTATLRMGANTTIAGVGRRSKITARRALPSILELRIAGGVGYAGGLRDLHLDGNDAADFAVTIDSWRNAKFSDIEANNLRTAFVRITSDQGGDSAGHVFENVWVRDEKRSGQVGSRFALLTAGATGKVTDTVFRDCAVTATQPLHGSPKYIWELRDTTRVQLDRCRATVAHPFDASVAITQEPDPPAGALVGDKSSGYTVVRDFYHEQHGSNAAVGVLIDGGRRARGQYQRGNVVENIDMQPSSATAVKVTNSGRSGVARSNRVLLPKRVAASPRVVVIDPGVAHTRVTLDGGNAPVSVGPSDDDTIRDRGEETRVAGLPSSTLFPGLAVWVDASRPRVSLGRLPAGSWVVAPVKVQVIVPFASASAQATIAVGTAEEPERYGRATVVDARGVKAMPVGGGEGYDERGQNVVASLTNARRDGAGRALVLLEYRRIGPGAARR